MICGGDYPEVATAKSRENDAPLDRVKRISENRKEGCTHFATTLETLPPRRNNNLGNV
jgi:hypothetical protein